MIKNWLCQPKFDMSIANEDMIQKTSITIRGYQDLQYETIEFDSKLSLRDYRSQDQTH